VNFPFPCYLSFKNYPFMIKILHKLNHLSEFIYLIHFSHHFNKNPDIKIFTSYIDPFTYKNKPVPDFFPYSKLPLLYVILHKLIHQFQLTFLFHVLNHLKNFPIINLLLHNEIRLSKIIYPFHFSYRS